MVRKNLIFLLNGINYINHTLSDKIDKSVTSFINSYGLFTVSNNERKLLTKNSTFENCHKGKRCFIIGNGPSISSQNLELLQNEITFVMNGFWKHPIIEKWHPKYFLLADPVYFDGSETMNDFFLNLRQKINRSEFFIPLSGRDIVEKNYLLPKERINYVQFFGSLSQVAIKKIDLTKIVPGVQSVSQFAILTAIYMGCNPIYLIGLDHDWLSHRGIDKHFYQGKTIENHSIAHGELGRISYKNDVIAVLKLWEGYEVIKHHSEKKRIKIFNATNGGFLDVFPRVRYESLFK
ncbi:MAG: hypothetical protein A4E59_01156 [Syntrophorhabdus sp. PtaB.Bin027]|nr:MAG: hypothetical protein A4E59_01156 [Syntrophorhabdus sp. PtaB.Bin027]